ncbi:DMT family transporter [Desulfovibrio falkowii]|mgnify:FL=1|uniref:Guanidinium exporter n=1 Tax=Desulfovibrio falkowii TaxID=3136602 RepID=A0ABQ0ECE6_9BACT|nr:SMR family transporter [uncultured Desulfovibrio sp.]MDY0204205.1 SMR family transporter [Desulfovibrio desulfuricans]
MSWVYLVMAGLLEIVVVAGVRDIAFRRYARGFVIYGLGLTSSLFFLYLALRQIDVSIAYTSYTGIGVIGTVASGLLFWGEKRSFRKACYVGLIVAAIVALKISG